MFLKAGQGCVKDYGGSWELSKLRWDVSGGTIGSVSLKLGGGDGEEVGENQLSEFWETLS